MRKVTQECKDLAQRILAYEAAGSQSAIGLTDALDRACDALARHMSRLIGPDGVQVLLSRALELAAADHPFLEGLKSESSSAGSTGHCLTGLQERVQDREFSEVHDGLVMILAAIIWLIMLMIGDPMAKNLIKQVWPEMPRDTRATRSKEEQS